MSPWLIRTPGRHSFRRATCLGIFRRWRISIDAPVSAQLGPSCRETRQPEWKRASLDFYTPVATFLKNVLISRNSDLYPAGNFFPPSAAAVGFTSTADNNYRLVAGSSYKDAGTDGLDLGADIDGVEDAMRELRLVTIDIKPGENPVTINTKSEGKLPLAILSSRVFSAPGMVDTASLTFGATGRELSLAFCNPNGEDVNGDGRLDLVCHFNTSDTGLKPGDTQALLKGRTVLNGLIEGSYNVRIVH